MKTKRKRKASLFTTKVKRVCTRCKHELESGNRFWSCNWQQCRMELCRYCFTPSDIQCQVGSTHTVDTHPFPLVNAKTARSSLCDIPKMLPTIFVLRRKRHSNHSGNWMVGGTRTSICPRGIQLGRLRYVCVCTGVV
jgi:hypothetical protein